MKVFKVKYPKLNRKLILYTFDSQSEINCWFKRNFYRSSEYVYNYNPCKEVL